MSDKNNNSGYRNSGDSNSGNSNSGNSNSGYRNSGNSNSGYRNSGDRNSGCWNSGNSNSGNSNSGYRNSGNWNSGNWNSGYWNSGYMNTNEPKVRIFNRETDLSRDEIAFPNFFYFDLTEWVQSDAMTDAEKEEHPECQTTGGYLKDIDYMDAWRIAWDKADDEDRKKVLQLPNWNNILFLEITGIDAEKELSGNTKKDDLLAKADELIEKANELKEQANKL